MPPETRKGCEYKKRDFDPPCNKVCDPGETLCPHHKLLTEHAKAQKQAKADDKTPRGYQE
jgi:hypothetical protein